jgi:predicted ATP-binding protein involved in virulence
MSNTCSFGFRCGVLVATRVPQVLHFIETPQIRLLSLGHFSRTELVRSFVRRNSDELPTVYEVRMRGGE